MPWSEHDPFLRREVENGIFTSPRGLAQARADLSSLILQNSSGNAETGRLAELATAKNIFGPDELNALKQLQTPLPVPWRPGKTADKFIPSDYQLCRLIKEKVQSHKRVGVYFMVADMINAGHLSALMQAKASGECDFLFLMLTTDLLTATMKSTAEDIRPKLSFEQRIYMASQIEAVDAIYAFPVVATHEFCIFEMTALAIAQQKLGGRFDNCQDKQIRPLDLETIIHLSRSQEDEWDFYMQAYLGISSSPWHLIYDPQQEFFRPDIYPPETQIPYQSFWTSFDLDRFTIFVTSHDKQGSDFHINQAIRCATNRYPKVVWIDPCYKSSSTVLFNHHPLRSEALADNLAILEMLKVRQDELFYGWKNPLLPKFPRWEPPL